ncbi:MAG: RidA family protein [Rhodanobacter sp.]
MKFYGSQAITPSGVPVPLSGAVEIDGFVFLSGVLALQDGKITGGIEEQTEVIFDTISAILGQAGLTLDHVIKATIWLTDPNDFAAFNFVYGWRLRAPFPARSCVISQLVVPSARIEIEVVASRNKTRL